MTMDSVDFEEISLSKAKLKEVRRKEWEDLAKEEENNYGFWGKLGLQHP